MDAALLMHHIEILRIGIRDLILVGLIASEGVIESQLVVQASQIQPETGIKCEPITGIIIIVVGCQHLCLV